MKYILYLVVVLLCMFYCDHAIGQIVDLQSSLNVKYKQGMQAKIAGAADTRSGNTEIQNYNLKTLVRYKHETPDILFFAYDREYGSRGGKEYLNNYFYHLRYRRIVTPFLNVELFGQSAHNKYRGFLQRNVYGGGPLLKWLDNDLHVFYTGLAGLIEYETSPGQKHDSVYRASVSVFYGLNFAEYTKFTLSGYYQPEIGDLKDTRTTVTGGFEIKISKNLGYSIQASYKHDTQPNMARIDKTDTRIKNALTLEW